MDGDTCYITVNMKRTGVSKNLTVCLLLIGVTLAAYWLVFRNGFVDYDDPVYITQNVHVQQGFTWKSIAWAFSTESLSMSGNWHPLTWMSLMLDHHLYGLNPVGYHLTNLLIHVLNSLLLFGLLMMTTGSRWRSAFVAALFAVHPLHVESVAWAAERKDVLSCLFGLLAIVSYVRYAALPTIKRYLLVVVLMILSLMTKPMLVSLPILLLLMDFWPLKRLAMIPPRTLLLEKIPLLVVSFVFCVVAMWSQGSTQSMVGVQDIPIGVRTANAVVSYAGYLGKMLWPRWLRAFYDHPGDTLPVWVTIGSAALLIAITAVAIVVRKKRPWVIVGWLWYVVTLLPVIGLVQIGRQGMADRYTYAPLIGIFLLIAWTIPERLSRVAAVPMVAAIGLLMLCTWRQVGYWRDGMTLVRHAIAAPGKNLDARERLVTIYEGRGEYDRAASELRTIIRLDPHNADARRDLAYDLARAARARGASGERSEP